MQFQKPDFGFIAEAGRQAGQTVENVAQAKRYDLSNQKADQAYGDIIDQYSQRFMERTGETDPMRAKIFVSKYFMPRFDTESGSDAAARWTSAEQNFEKALGEEAKRRYYKEIEAGKPQEIQRKPTGQVQPGTPQTSGPLGRPSSAFAGSLPQLQEQVLNEPGAPGVTTPPMTSQEQYDLARKYQVSGEADVREGIASTGRSEVSGTRYPAGTASSQVYRDVMGKPVIDEVTLGYAKEFPTEYQQMTNKRLTDAEDQRSRLRMALAKMQDARDRAKNLDKNTLRLLDTQINAVKAQIQASKATSDLALGIPSGKDVMGRQTFSTGVEWEKEYKDAESTLQSATALLEKIDALNANINPVPGRTPVGGKPKFKIINVQ